MKKTAAAALIALSGVATASPSIKQLDAEGRRLALSPCTKPEAVASMVVANKYDQNIQDEIRTVRCPGVQAETYRAAHAALPIRVELKIEHGTLPPELQVGTPRASVKRFLGKSPIAATSSDTYPLSEERPDQDSVTFTYKSGRVSSIIWSWSID